VKVGDNWAEVSKGQSEGGILTEGALIPLPPAKGSWEHCNHSTGCSTVLYVQFSLKVRIIPQIYKWGIDSHILPGSNAYACRVAWALCHSGAYC